MLPGPPGATGPGGGHRTGGAELSARGTAPAPRHRQPPQSGALSPSARLPGTVLAPVSPRGSQGPMGAAATGYDTQAATLAVPGVTGARVSPGLSARRASTLSPTVTEVPAVPPSRGSCPSPSPRPALVSCRGPVSAPHSVAQGGGSGAAGAPVRVGGDGWPWMAWMAGVHNAPGTG